MNEERKFYVYAYLRSRNSANGNVGTPYYIGKGSNHRAYSKQRIVSRPPEPSRILLLCNGATEVDAFQAEMLLIFLYGRLDLHTGILHNRTDGGDGMSNPSPDTRKKLSSSRIGASNPFFGKTHTALVRQRVSNARKERTGDRNAFFGRRHSEATRSRISDTLRLYPKSFLSNQLCECGCGDLTRIAQKTDKVAGIHRGEPRRFVSGHNRRKH